jgi:hypothetical protein
VVFRCAKDLSALSAFDLEPKALDREMINEAFRYSRALVPAPRRRNIHAAHVMACLRTGNHADAERLFHEYRALPFEGHDDFSQLESQFGQDH